MARINEGFLSGFRGKIGNIVGCKTKSGYYIRRRPVKSLNPPTVKQLAQRTKFKLAQSFLAGLRPLLKTLPLTGEKNTFAYHAAISQLVREAISGLYPDQAIDYSLVKLTSGLLGRGCDHVVTAGKGTLHFSWCHKNHECIYQDLAVVLAYDPVENKWIYQIVTVGRGCRNAELNLTPDFTGREVETWMYFFSYNGQAVSEGVYTGRHHVNVQMSK